MTAKRIFILLLMSVLLTFMAGCEKKNDHKGYASNEKTASKTYGCIADEIIKLDRKLTYISRNFLSHDSASKVRVLHDDNEFKWIVIGAAVNSAGASVSSRIECENVSAVGFAVSGDNIVLVKEDNDEGGKPIVEIRSIHGDVVSEVRLDTDYKISSPDLEICVDKWGYIHISNMEKADENTTVKGYCVFDSTGKMCEELMPPDSGDASGKKTSYELGMLPDERIFADFITYEGEENMHHKLSVYDAESNKSEAIIEYDSGQSDGEGVIFALNVFDDSHIVYMTERSISLADYSFNNRECIFEWKKNGVEFVPRDIGSGAYRICADSEGKISVLLDKGDKAEYLKLAEIPEEVFTVEIAGCSGTNQYGRAVVEYNRLHSDSRIVINNDYDKTALLTRVIAGDGPVIIEDGVINARDRGDIWEPLENLVAPETIGKLNKGALICGSINDKLYGAATGFYVDTLVTGERLSDWNYDEFISAINNNDKLLVITDNSLLSGRQEVIEAIFCSGCCDTFFVDTENKNEVVDGKRLETIMELIDKYQTADNIADNFFDMVADGTMLCARFSVHSPLDYYGILYAFGEKGSIAGYPGKNGSKHYIIGTGTLFARKNMTAKEREVVSDFFELLLSYEGQSQIYLYDPGAGLSARKDVLDIQIDNLKEYEGEKGALGGVWFVYKNIDSTKVRDKLNELLEKGVPFPRRNDDFYEIVEEELDDYYNGETDLDTLKKNLGKRINLYIKERE